MVSIFLVIHLSLVIPPAKFAMKTYNPTLDMNPPVINIAETLFDAIGGVELSSICLQQNNDEAAGKEVDVIITKDGTVYTYDASSIGDIASGSEHVVILNPSNPDGTTTFELDLSAYIHPKAIIDHQSGTTAGAGFMLKGHSIKVEIKLTQAAGTNQRIYVKAFYNQLEAV